jgi:hypothetical protein
MTAKVGRFLSRNDSNCKVCYEQVELKLEPGDISFGVP